MKRFFLLLMLMLSGTLHAQDQSPVLYWATDAGQLGRYDPVTQTQMIFELEDTINTNQIQWLPDTGVFVYQPEEAIFQTINAASGVVLCSLTPSLLLDWDVLSATDNTLALYESVENQTRITRLNWRTCASETLGIVDGILQLSSVSPDVPLLALETLKKGLLSIYILDFATGTIKTLDVRPWQSNALYWIQDSASLVTGELSPIALYERATDTIHTVDGLDGILWLYSETPLLSRSLEQAGALNVQIWTFEGQQIGTLLLEIPDETYDHLPNFSPQDRYYAYSRTSIPNVISIFDRQTGKTHTLEDMSGLWHWSADGQWLGVLNWDADVTTVYNPQTEEQRTYNGTPDWYGGYGMWSPVGQTLVFWQAEGEKQSLMVANMVDGTAVPAYTQTISDYPTSVSWSSDGEYLYLGVGHQKADGTPERCHIIVDIAAKSAQTLGCDQSGRSEHWGK